MNNSRIAAISRAFITLRALQRSRALICSTQTDFHACEHRSKMKSKPESRQLSSSYEPNRVAKPDEVNYALIQNMGEGFCRRMIKISALGTTFDMVYGEWAGIGNSSENCPVVLCVHGAPATDAAFRPIGSLIAAQGYRMLAVNAPGMGLTEVDPGKRYKFTTAHKVELVKAFLRELQIDRVAMVIGHSMGSHIVGNLASDPELDGVVQSVCFLCGTGTMPHRMHDYCTAIPYLPVLIYNVMNIPVLGWFVTYFFARIVHSLGFRGKTPQSQVNSLLEGHNLRFDVYRSDLDRIAEKRLPTLLIYSLDDQMVEAHLIPPTIDALDIPSSDVKNYDDDGHSLYEYSERTLRRAVRFTKATHRVQFTHPQQTTHEIVSLLDAVTGKLERITSQL